MSDEKTMNSQLPAAHEPLSDAVAALLPGAQVIPQALPGIDDLHLLLLNPDYPQHELPPEQAARLMDEPLYWTFCWASGLVLARWLMDNPDAVAGKRVLDFGAGSGVVAIAAARCGATEVIACDLDPLALRACAANAALNDVDLTLASDYAAVEGDIDVILVADVLYDRSNLPWLSRFLGRAKDVVMADTRLPDFKHPNYRFISQHEASTWPDLDESQEFRKVRLYCSTATKESN